MLKEFREEQIQSGKIICACHYPMCCCFVEVENPNEKCGGCAGGTHISNGGCLVGEFRP